MSDTTTFARRERAALCDLALEVGADAPTLCEGWDVADLVSHLLVRERRPWAAAGILLPPAARLTDRAMAGLKRRDFVELVTTLRKPSLLFAGPIDPLANTVEFFVHHEDIRRAQPGWAPRELAPDDERALWRNLAGAGRMAVRKAGVPLVVESDGRRATLSRGEEPLVLSGPVSELLLLVFGRSEVRDVSWDGCAEKIQKLRSAQLGI